MYLWKTDDLVKDFHNNNVSSAEEFKYYFVDMLIWTLFSGNYISSGDTSTSDYEYVFIIITLIINSIGCYANFRLNQHGDDKDFIKRTFCLSIPITIKILTVMFSALIILSFFTNEQGDLVTDYGILSNTVLSYVFFIWPISISYYYLLSRKLEKIAYYTPPIIEIKT